MRAKPDLPSKPPRPKWLSLGDVSAMYSISRQTAYNWVRRGVLVGGKQIRLRAEWIGGKWITRRRWLKEFRTAVNAAKTADLPGRVAEEQPDKRQERFRREQEEAARVLGRGRR